VLEQRLDRISEPRSDRVDIAVLDEVPGVLNRVAHPIEAGLESLDHGADERPGRVLKPLGDRVDRVLDQAPDRLRDELPALEAHLEPADDNADQRPPDVLKPRDDRVDRRADRVPDREDDVAVEPLESVADPLDRELESGPADVL